MEYTNLLLQEHYKSAIEYVGDSNKIVATCLYGSQNYGLQNEFSDVDTKTFVIPTVKELLNYKQVSIQINGDQYGGLNDVKHISLMCDNFLKQNINFLEILYTPFEVVNPLYEELFNELKSQRDFISGANIRRTMHASAGMASQKFHALKHPYASKKEVLDNYGYDPKQLASLLRLFYFIKTYLKTRNFMASITPEGEFKDFIMSVKAGSLPLVSAENIAVRTMTNITSLIHEEVDSKIEVDNERVAEAKKFLDNWCEKVMLKSLSYEFGGKVNGFN